MRSSFLNLRKGISPLIASVLLLAFTISVAMLAGPFFSNTLKNSQAGVKNDTESLLKASEVGLDISKANYNSSSGNLTVTVTNTGTESINGNFTATVYGNKPAQRRIRADLSPGQMRTFQIDTNSTESLTVSSENLPVEVNTDRIKNSRGVESGSDDEGSLTAAFSVSSSNPYTGDSVSFDASGSTDPQNSISNYEWDWDEDNSYEGLGEIKSWAFAESGEKVVELNVTDSDDNYATDTKTIDVRHLDTSIIESFEQSDLGDYQKAGNDAGKNDYSIQTTYATDGSRNLRFSGDDGGGAIYTYNLTDKPVFGDNIKWEAKFVGDQTVGWQNTRVNFRLYDNSSGDQLRVKHRYDCGSSTSGCSDEAIYIWIYDNSGTTVGSDSVSTGEQSPGTEFEYFLDTNRSGTTLEVYKDGSSWKTLNTGSNSVSAIYDKFQISVDIGSTEPVTFDFDNFRVDNT